MQKMNTLLSIIVVNYNGVKYIHKCINSILSSNAKRYEIIIIDNGSIDNSLKLQDKYQNEKEIIKIIFLDKNYGPAFARNIGVRNSNGKYLCFLDNDTIVDKNWSFDPIKIFTKDKKVGVIQSKLLLNSDKNKIDYVGEFIGQNGFLVQPVKAGEIDNGQFNNETEILAAKSAGMFIRKQTFQKVNGFDPDYFIYLEETDLGWRSWLVGYKVVFCPTSIVYHEFGTSTLILGKKQNSFNSKFHGSKNYILTLAKNLEWQNLFKMLSIHVFLWEGLACYSLLKGNFKSFLWINRGILWNITNIKSTIKKRNEIQKSRKISDKNLFSKVMKKRSYKYFINKAVNKHKVGNAESF